MEKAQALVAQHGAELGVLPEAEQQAAFSIAPGFRTTLLGQQSTEAETIGRVANTEQIIPTQSDVHRLLSLRH